MTDIRPVNIKPIEVVFEKVKEGVDKVHYREIHPGGVVGTFYLSRLAIHYQYDGAIPSLITITIKPGATPE